MPTAARNCPYCKSEIPPSGGIIGCSECGTIHHSSCWNQYGRCSVFGCRANSDRIRPSLSLLIPPTLLFFLTLPRLNFSWLIAFVIPPTLVLSAVLGFYFLIHVIEAGYIRETLGAYEIRWNLYFFLIYTVSVLLFLRD